MLCEKCGKNEATIRYSEIVNGKKTEMALCGECAAAMGLGSDGGFGLGDLFGAGTLFSNIFGAIPDARPQYGASHIEKRCPVCGASMSEIAKRGKVGCAECYRTFKSELAPSIRRIHGDVKYVGDAPAKSEAENSLLEKKQKLESLRRELREAIEKEDFERAAEIRDSIRKIDS